VSRFDRNDLPGYHEVRWCGEELARAVVRGNTKVLEGPCRAEHARAVGEVHAGEVHLKIRNGGAPQGGLEEIAVDYLVVPDVCQDRLFFSAYPCIETSDHLGVERRLQLLESVGVVQHTGVSGPEIYRVAGGWRADIAAIVITATNGDYCEGKPGPLKEVPPAGRAG
jgi:hypothetical protein